MKKTILTIALTMVMCFAIVGTTFAWLVDSTAPIKNTFTVGNVDIELVETKGTKTDDENFSFKMVPGNTIEKDPTVTVKANSEDCYLFVKIAESTNLDDFITYAVAGGWTALDGQTGVFYREVTTSDQDQSFAVIEGNKVTVNTSVTKTMVDAITGDPSIAPTLTFTAYAVQKANVADAETAWSILNPTT